MSDIYDGPELHGVPTQEQLDEQTRQAEALGWEFPEPGCINFRCDKLVEHYDEGFLRCENSIEVKTSHDEYTVAAHQEAREGMVTAGWTWGADFDYCPEHSKGEQ